MIRDRTFSIHECSIAGIVWAGNVEIHTRSSHFYHHGHHNDPAFNNVIFHVVAVNDKKVFNSRGEELLTVEMFYDQAIYEKYISLVNYPYIIACEDEIKCIEKILIDQWL